MRNRIAIHNRKRFPGAVVNIYTHALLLSFPVTKGPLQWKLFYIKLKIKCNVRVLTQWKLTQVDSKEVRIIWREQGRRNLVVHFVAVISPTLPICPNQICPKNKQVTYFLMQNIPYFAAVIPLLIKVTNRPPFIGSVLPWKVSSFLIF